MSIQDHLDWLDKIHYALLDLDGTLTASTGAWHGAVIAEAIKRTGFKSNKEITPEIAQEAYNGLGHGKDYFALLKQNLFDRYFPKSSDVALSHFRGRLPEVAKELKRGDIYQEEIKALPGAKEFLEKLKETGIRLAIVTMTPSYLAEAILQRAGLQKISRTSRISTSEPIEAIYGCELFTPDESKDPEPRRKYKQFLREAKGLKKSDPELWSKVLGMTFDDPIISRCLIAEDGSAGIEGAAQFLEGQGLLIVLKKSNLAGIKVSGETNLLIADNDGDWTKLTKT